MVTIATLLSFLVLSDRLLLGLKLQLASYVSVCERAVIRGQDLACVQTRLIDHALINTTKGLVIDYRVHSHLLVQFLLTRLDYDRHIHLKVTLFWSLIIWRHISLLRR